MTVFYAFCACMNIFEFRPPKGPNSLFRPPSRFTFFISSLPQISVTLRACCLYMLIVVNVSMFADEKKIKGYNVVYAKLLVHVILPPNV